MTEKLATKEDMTRLEMRLENLIKEEISGLRNDTKEEITGLRNDTKEEITGLRNETKQEFIRINGKFNLLNWMVSFLLAGVMATLFKLFLH